MQVFERGITDNMHSIWRHVQDGHGPLRDDRPDSVFFRSGRGVQLWKRFLNAIPCCRQCVSMFRASRFHQVLSPSR